MSYMELFKIVSRPWASIKEIRQIAQCGRDTAIKIRNEIETQIKNSGYNLPNGKTIIVPMQSVLDYLHLDLNYITEMALNEKKLNLENNYRIVNNANLSKQENKAMGI